MKKWRRMALSALGEISIFNVRCRCSLPHLRTSSRHPLVSSRSGILLVRSSNCGYERPRHTSNAGTLALGSLQRQPTAFPPMLPSPATMAAPFGPLNVDCVVYTEHWDWCSCSIISASTDNAGSSYRSVPQSSSAEPNSSYHPQPQPQPRPQAQAR